MELWERFTSRARRAVLLAHTEAARANSALISTEHLLGGLLRLPESTAQQALGELDVDIERLRADLEHPRPAQPEAEVGPDIAFTPEARQVLQFALTEAAELGAANVGTEHVLLGLLRLGKGPAFRVLQSHGVDVARVRVVLESGE